MTEKAEIQKYSASLAAFMEQGAVLMIHINDLSLEPRKI